MLRDPNGLDVLISLKANIFYSQQMQFSALTTHPIKKNNNNCKSSIGCISKTVLWPSMAWMLNYRHDTCITLVVSNTEDKY